MNKIGTRFMSFENLNTLIEQHRKETQPYENYEFDSTSYTLLLADINNLLKENQELKKKYENAVADYEATMFEKEQLNSLVNSCQEEIRQLEKQLEEYKKKLMRITKMEIKQIDEATFVGIDYFQDKCIMLKAQQKEFIKWLEDIINTYIYSNLDDYKNVLQKYKEIVNGDDK